MQSGGVQYARTLVGFRPKVKCFRACSSFNLNFHRYRAQAASTNGIATKLATYDTNLFTAINNGLGSRYGRMGDELSILVADVQAAAEQRCTLPAPFLSNLYMHVVPPEDGSFMAEFGTLLEALHKLGAAPPGPWMAALDRALHAHLLDEDGHMGPERALPEAQSAAAIHLATAFQRARVAVDGAQRAPMAPCYPFTLEACLRKQLCSSTKVDQLQTHPASLVQALDAYHEVLGPGRQWAKVLYHPLLPFQSQEALMARYLKHMTPLELSVLVENAVVALDIHRSGSVEHAEAQAQITCALEALHTQVQQQLQAAASGKEQGQEAASSGSHSNDMQNGLDWDLDTSLMQQLVACMRAGLQLAEVQGQQEEAGYWLALAAPALDALCAGKDHPAILTNGLVILSQAAQLSPTWRTPGQAVAVLSGHLQWFTDTQLLDALRALGHFTALHASRSSGNAAEGDGLVSTAVGSSSAQGAALVGQGVVIPLEVLLHDKQGSGTRASSLPDDMADNIDAQYPAQGPAYDSDRSLDLLARIGLRLSRGLLSQSGVERAQTLSQLGLDQS